VGKGKRVTVCWRQKLDSAIEVVQEDKRLALVEIWGHQLEGIYADGKLRGRGGRNGWKV